MTLDPLRPRLHPRPSRGWINDPNGIGFWDGAWHVMAQHNPRAAVWGDIEWCHLSSPDLLTWTEHPAAVVPRPGTIDADGVWSGVAHHVDGVPHLVYTAVAAGAGDATDRARVAVARPDGRGGWTQPDVTVTGPAPDDVRDVRDPFLFHHRGHRYAVQGARTRDDVPLVLLYDADDLDRWQLLGPLLRGDDPVAREHAPGLLWECPQLVAFDGRWVLLLSLWDDSVPGCEEFGPQRTAWLVGDLVDDGGLRYVPTGGGSLDDGSALYAPQAVVHDDRTLVWGWAWEGTRSTPPADLPPRDWAGILTYPRELRLGAGDDGAPALLSALVPEVGGAFAAPVEATDLPTWLAEIGSPDGPVRRVALDLEQHGAATRVLEVSGSHVVVTVDGSILEAFVDGRAITHRVHPDADARWHLVSDGTPVGIRPPT